MKLYNQEEGVRREQNILIIICKRFQHYIEAWLIKLNYY